MSAHTGKHWAEVQGVVSVSWSFAASAGKLYDFSRYITEASWQDVIRDAFDLWSSVTDIQFVETRDQASNDIRLGWDTIDGQYNRIGEASWQYRGEQLVRAEVVFDQAENWTVDGAGRSMNFFATAVHEIGHAIGLDHVADGDSIMNALLSDQRGLTEGDIANIQQLYGQPDDHASQLQAGHDHAHDHDTHVADQLKGEWLNHPDLIDVVAATYQFFTGSVPSVAGFDYLIHSEANATDLTDAYYSEFNIENLFINFTTNLALEAGTKTAFVEEYAELEFGAFVETIYDEIIGFDNAQSAGLDAEAGILFFENSEAYYAQIAAERGVSDYLDGDLGTKLVALGSMLHEATRADAGHYGEAIDGMHKDLSATGLSEMFSSDLFAFG